MTKRRASDFTEEDLAAAKRRRELEEKIDRDDRLTPAFRTVGRELLRWVHREVEHSWISAGGLAKKLKLSVATVERALPTLERCGYFVGTHRPGQSTLYQRVDELPTAPPTSIKMREVTSRKMSKAPPSKRTKNLHQNEGESLREISLKNLSEAPPPPPTVRQADREATLALIMRTHNCDRSAAAAILDAIPDRVTTAPPPRTITADQVAAVITDKPIPPTAIDVTPPTSVALSPSRRLPSGCPSMQPGRR
jgi:ribosomal protein S25